jgi:hypothetical protein
MARFEGGANIASREASKPVMIGFMRKIVKFIIKLHESSLTFQVAAISPMSATRTTGRMREQGQEAFTRMIQDISGRIDFVSIPADSGTVLGFYAVYRTV